MAFLLVFLDDTADPGISLLQGPSFSVRQLWILQSGKVTADRLFIIAPKSLGAPAKGQSRVNLSLS